VVKQKNKINEWLGACPRIGIVMKKSWFEGFFSSIGFEKNSLVILKEPEAS